MVAIETGVVATIGNVDVDWFEDDDSHTFKFNLPGISLSLCVARFPYCSFLFLLFC